MNANNAQAHIFKKFIGVGLIALALLGATSLCMKEVPLALLGERTTGIVSFVFVTVCLLLGLRCMSRKPFFPTPGMSA